MKGRHTEVRLGQIIYCREPRSCILGRPSLLRRARVFSSETKVGHSNKVSSMNSKEGFGKKAFFDSNYEYVHGDVLTAVPLGHGKAEKVHAS